MTTRQAEYLKSQSKDHRVILMRICIKSVSTLTGRNLSLGVLLLPIRVAIVIAVQ